MLRQQGAHNLKVLECGYEDHLCNPQPLQGPLQIPHILKYRTIRYEALNLFRAATTEDTTPWTTIDITTTHPVFGPDIITTRTRTL